MAYKYVFSGHESFPCKALWLKKGYDFVVQGKSFNNPDAVIDLGVGKNMVASIRYWLRVFGILEGDQISWIGDYLFDDISAGLISKKILLEKKDLFEQIEVYNKAIKLLREQELDGK